MLLHYFCLQTDTRPPAFNDVSKLKILMHDQNYIVFIQEVIVWHTDTGKSRLILWSAISHTSTNM